MTEAFFFLAFWLYHMSCGILVPDQGSNSCLLQWNQPLGHQGSPLTDFFFFNGRQLSICTQISIKSELTKESKEDIEWLPTCNPDSHMDWPLQTFEFRLPGGV